MSSIAPFGNGTNGAAAVTEGNTKPLSLKDWQVCRERIHAAKRLLLSFDMLVSTDRDRKPQTISASLRFLSASASKIVLLSNDSTRLAGDVQAFLGRCGIVVPEQQIHLAGQHTLRYLQESAAATPVALIAEPRLEREADRLGLRRTALDAEMLVFMQDGRFDLYKTALAATLVRQGVDVLVTARSGGSIASDGWVAPGPWSHLLASLAAAERLHHPVTISGLPSPGMLWSALTQAEASPDETVMLALADSPAAEAALRLKIATIALSRAQDLDRLV
jgi:ribonucleotide monophosphatase NagD (HAD superfamily)